MVYLGICDSGFCEWPESLLAENRKAGFVEPWSFDRFIISTVSGFLHRLVIWGQAVPCSVGHRNSTNQNVVNFWILQMTGANPLIPLSTSPTSCFNQVNLS